MAYYFGDEDKDKNVNDQTFQTSKDSSVIGQAPGGSTSAMPNNASVNNAKTNPGNFVGISQYLDANKPQSADLSNKVGGVITGAADTARNELNTKVADTQNQINANTVNYDQKAIDQLNQDATKADVSKINAMKNASYQGPDTLGSIDSLAAAQQRSQQADSEEGRKALVGDLYKDSPLKKGALTFDNLLLQEAPEAKSTLANAQKQADVTGLTAQAGTQKAQLEAAAQAARATDAATAQNTQNAIGSAQSAFETGLQGRVDAARKAATDNAQGVIDRLSSATPPKTASDSDLALAGITQDQYQKLLAAGQGLTGAKVGDASGITAANVASADDYARYNVLKKLAEGGTFLGDDASNAGKYNSNLLNYKYAEPVVAPPAPTAAAAAAGAAANSVPIINTSSPLDKALQNASNDGGTGNGQLENLRTAINNIPAKSPLTAANNHDTGTANINNLNNAVSNLGSSIGSAPKKITASVAKTLKKLKW